MLRRVGKIKVAHLHVLVGEASPDGEQANVGAIEVVKFSDFLVYKMKSTKK